MELQTFLGTWGIDPRLSSAYNPHGNTRAEFGVKSIRRVIQDNLSSGGTLDNDRFSRNTPDRDTNRSPTQVLFGRQVRDFIPFPIGKYQPRQEWFLTQDKRERALRRTHLLKRELTLKTQVLSSLAARTVVSIQNQRGAHSKNVIDKDSLRINSDPRWDPVNYNIILYLARLPGLGQTINWC